MAETECASAAKTAPGEPQHVAAAVLGHSGISSNVGAPRDFKDPQPSDDGVVIPGVEQNKMASAVTGDSAVSPAGSQEEDAQNDKVRSVRFTRGRPSGRRGCGRRGGGRRLLHCVAARRLVSTEAQDCAEVQQEPSSSLSAFLQERDFCFSNLHASATCKVCAAGPTSSDPGSSRVHVSPTVAALHRLLPAHAAASAIAAGTKLSALWQTAGVGSSTGFVCASYSDTPEGRFLCAAPLPSDSGPLLRSDASHRAYSATRELPVIKTESLRFDVRGLGRDLIPFPLPVLCLRSSDGANAASRQQTHAGICVVPPLKSASPCCAADHWCKSKDSQIRNSSTSDAPAQNQNGCSDSAAAADAASAQETHTDGGRAEADALLNVGGSVLAVAVSQECGVAEALAHCRYTLASTCGRAEAEGGAEGFVVLAVSVGTLHPPSASTSGAASGSSSCLNESSGGGIDNSGSVYTLHLRSAERCQPLRDQHRSGMGLLQLWKIPSNNSRLPRLQLFVQHNGGSCRSLHWVPNSQLLLPRCSKQQHTDGEGCCCADGSDCYRSRLGLLLGVTDDGSMCLWSVPLSPFLPKSHESPCVRDEASERQRGEEPGTTRTPTVKAELDSRTWCCVLPPVWRFNPPGARFFCCAAAPHSCRVGGVPEPHFPDSVQMIGGAGEGRLYTFTFSTSLHPSPCLPSQQLAGDGVERSEFNFFDAVERRLQASMFVISPGCQSSEVRCCSFLPVSGSSLVALALRASRSRSGSVVVLDLSRAAVSASTGCRGVAAVQGQCAVADSAAFQVVEGNCGCCRSREIHDLVWSPWARYLVASAENALIINLDRKQVKQLPLRSLQNSRGRKPSASNPDDDGDRCCWGCTALGPLVFYCFGGGCLVQGEAAELERRAHGSSRFWQWCFADGENQEALSAAMQQEPHLVHARTQAGKELQKQRRTLLYLLKAQMSAAAPRETLQPTQQQTRLPVDMMQQRVKTLLALQQLDERCDLLSRGLVIAEGDAIGAILHSRGKRTARGAAMAPSILALHRVASICPWANPRFFAAAPRVVYGGAAGIMHMKGVQMQG